MLRVWLQVGFQEDLVSNSETQSAGSNSNLSFPASCGISNEVTPDTVQRDCESFQRVVPTPPLGSARVRSLSCRLETQNLSLGGYRRREIEIKLGICPAARLRTQYQCLQAQLRQPACAVPTANSCTGGPR